MKLFNEPKEFTLYNMFKLFSLNKRFTLISIFAFVGFLIVISYIIPQKYVAVSSLMPPKKDGGGGGLSSFIQNFAGGGLSLGNLGQSDQSKVFGEIVKSRTVAEYIIDKMNLKNIEPYSKFSRDKLNNYVLSRISVDVDKSGIIYIASKIETGFFPSGNEGKSASKFAADMVNTAVEGLDLVIRDRNMSSARQSKEYVEKEIFGYMQKLDSIETRLEIFQKENKVLAIDEQTQAIVAQAIEVGAQLAKADLEKNLALLQFQVGSPQYQFYEKQHELLSEQYRKIQSGGLTKDESFSLPLDKVPGLIKEYVTLFRERKIIEQVLLYLETQRHQEAIQEKRDVPVVEVLDSAYAPEERVSPKRILMAALGLLLSIIFVFVFISIKAFTSGSIYLKDINEG
jgi:capsular polysaccharide biosynthesis protein